ncbi:uncharacterized protein CEXT_275191 [Caerostris extrusa]|uniref:Ubiquitin-like protease family profile domain-containing protein n=1 Tax=Caerostris extrusa TaxID=172846 RepID=A0AAV4NFF0_CAEEX|nr:uncharacterized protein CEXT_275191 [Caerostris extrusa]
MLPEKRGHYQSFIVNTDSSMSTGQHWHAIFFDNNQNCVFFCSYGTYPIEIIKKFIERNSIRMDWNSLILQHPKTTSCGLFCLYFLWHMNRGLTIERLRKTNVCENERIVTRFARVQLKLTNHSTILSSNQFCRSLQKYDTKNKRKLGKKKKKQQKTYIIKGTNSGCYIILRVVAITLLISIIMGSPPVDWVVFSRDTRLGENVIRSLKDNLDWGILSQYQTLSESFIAEFRSKVDWKKICRYQKLSENFIRQCLSRGDPIDMSLISEFQSVFYFYD